MGRRGHRPAIQWNWPSSIKSVDHERINTSLARQAKGGGQVHREETISGRLTFTELECFAGISLDEIDSLELDSNVASVIIFCWAY